MSENKDKNKNKGKSKSKDKDDLKDSKEKIEKDNDEKAEKDKTEDIIKLSNKENDKDKDQDKSCVLPHLTDAVGRKCRELGSSSFNEDFKLYKGSCISLGSPEIITICLQTGVINRSRQLAKDEQIGTQRVFKKTSPNSVITLYLPTREMISTGNQPAILNGVLHADPKSIQGYRVYAQLTLTFRYGREDEEVMGLRFCNEAIMCLQQLWPNDEPPKESLTQLQEALIKRLGDCTFPFTLTLTPQAPPSVQLVPAKRYYGAPIGTSYEIRCFIADKTDDKFHKRATVRMGVRVIHRTDIFTATCPENFTSIVNNQLSPPPTQDLTIVKTASENTVPSHTATTATTTTTEISSTTTTNTSSASQADICTHQQNILTSIILSNKSKKSERVDSFPKIRLSPKSFRFSNRFSRSKSETEKTPSEPMFCYSKSFQEYDSCGGPQGSVDKPFLLQEGRVSLKASLDKAWYTHGEDIIVTINIKNNSRKSVRKIRVCAIQHVDVCMFNNGKFKNVVADSDVSSPGDKTVGPGSSLNATIVLKPQRGPTKNWIALEDSLQRSCDPDEITGLIAASAVRIPNVNPPTSLCTTSNNPTICHTFNQSLEDRNVFAIYVSYYVKVKLTLSGMGGELSLKLPFSLVHIDSSKSSSSVNKLKNETVELSTENHSSVANESIDILNKTSSTSEKNTIEAPELSQGIKHSPIVHQDSIVSSNIVDRNTIDRIESVDDNNQDLQIHCYQKISKSPTKRRLIRHETLVKDDSSDDDEGNNLQTKNITVQLEQLEKTPLDNQKRQNSPSDIDDGYNIRIENREESPTESSSSPPLESMTTGNKQTTCVQVHTTTIS